MGFRSSETLKAFHIVTNPETLHGFRKKWSASKNPETLPLFRNPFSVYGFVTTWNAFKTSEARKPFFPSKSLLKESEISPETYSGFRNQPGNLFGFSNARKPIFRGSREIDFYLECIVWIVINALVKTETPCLEKFMRNASDTMKF